MKYLSALFISLLLLSQSSPLAAQTKTPRQAPLKVLRNGDVLLMVAEKLPPEVIVQTIQKSPCVFDTFPPVLRELKRKGVPESVVNAMVVAPSGPSSVERKARPAEPPPTVPLTIEDGTVIEVTAPGTISSAEVTEGGEVVFRVIRSVKVDGVTVIAPGAAATARVIRAKKGESWGRAGELVLSMQHVTAVDGRQVALQFEREIKGDNKGTTVATGAAATAAIAGASFPPLVPLAALWLFVRGEEATVPSGAPVKITVRGDTQVNAIKPHAKPAAYIDAATQRQIDARPPAALVSLSRESILRRF